MCDAFEGEYPSCWRSIWRRARKQHRCMACSETIEPGQRYRYSSGVWEGTPGSFKHCARCWHLYTELCDRSHDDVAIMLDCGETWESSFGEAPPSDIAALAFLTSDEAQRLVAE